LFAFTTAISALAVPSGSSVTSWAKLLGFLVAAGPILAEKLMLVNETVGKPSSVHGVDERFSNTIG